MKARAIIAVAFLLSGCASYNPSALSVSTGAGSYGGAYYMSDGFYSGGYGPYFSPFYYPYYFSFWYSPWFHYPYYRAGYWPSWYWPHSYYAWLSSTGPYNPYRYRHHGHRGYGPAYRHGSEGWNGIGPVAGAGASGRPQAPGRIQPGDLDHLIRADQAGPVRRLPGQAVVAPITFPSQPASIGRQGAAPATGPAQSQPAISRSGSIAPATPVSRPVSGAGRVRSIDSRGSNSRAMPDAYKRRDGPD